jgi:hypothetical protein
MIDEAYGEYEDFFEEEKLDLYPRDKVIDQAKDALKEFFNQNNEDVFYMQQLAVLFEKPFFHWITSKAINELILDGFLNFETHSLLGATHIKFVFRKGYRYYRRQINEKLKVVRGYSDPVIAGACGRQAEVLFFNALTNKGFLSHGQSINEYQGKKWTETDHDLDFILERDGKVYGAEVKNKLGYIDEDELDIKLKICEFIGVKPLFIMRGSPKSYNWRIKLAGGYAMIFVAQIYAFGQQALVQNIKKTLGLEADCPKAIPSGIIERFMKWHSENQA